MAAFVANLEIVETLFAATNDLLSFADGGALANDPTLLNVARYLAGPPISADDLNTLAGSNVAKRRVIDHAAARAAAHVIETAIDPQRFPWLYDRPPRSPTQVERDLALRWTTGLQTAQEIQKKRRSESSARQELAVARVLDDLGFNRVTARSIDITGGLAPGEYSREALVSTKKCDVPVGLRDGRVLFIECKVSNSAVNSIKRLNRETAGKAEAWHRAFGDRAITAAVLAGVFKLTNLRDAQTDGVHIFWEHDLRPLREFLNAAL